MGALKALPSEKTNSDLTHENGWLDYDPFLLGWLIFRGEMLVSGLVKCYSIWPD